MEKVLNLQEKTPRWIRPDLKKEDGELIRVIQDFLGKEINTENIDKLVEILDNSPLSELSDKDWEALENTDSFRRIKPGQLEEARVICEGYNDELEEIHKRDFSALLNAFRSGNEMECPVIIRNSKNEMHLMSGNTRLMIARALGIQPQVIVADIL